MSEFTATGQRVSSRHHSSTISRHVEETRVLDSTYKNESAAQNPHDDQHMLNTTPETSTPPHQQSLSLASKSPSMPFPSDQTPISHFPSTETQNDIPSQNQRQSNIESGGGADTVISPRDDALHVKNRLINSISALEQLLHTERSTVTNLTSTLS